MDKHVPKLETCKKLKELGYPQNPCEFIIGLDDNGKEYIAHGESERCFGVKGQVRAPLATELLEWLPTYIQENTPSVAQRWSLRITKTDYDDKPYWIGYTNNDMEVCQKTSYFLSSNLAQCIAQMLIYLVENKIVSFEKELK